MSAPWPWLRNLITGLLDRPPLGFMEDQVDEDHVRRHPIWPNRIQAQLHEPLYHQAN